MRLHTSIRLWCCFNPFQGIQVLSVGKQRRAQCWEKCFNPFQGIQVLSENAMHRTKGTGLQFQSLSGNSSVVGHEGPVWCRHMVVSIPFREFKCCRYLVSEVVGIYHTEFQSLSGNSSVVGDIRRLFSESGFKSFNPFQGIQVLSEEQQPAPPQPGNRSFNPFQGIQVLSVQSRHPGIRSGFSVSIPFREFKCCRGAQERGKPASRIYVSIPFREFKCCRCRSTPRHSATWSFNPFQGIQVLSGPALWSPPWSR